MIRCFANKIKGRILNEIIGLRSDDIMNSIRRRILGFQLYSNAEILLESRRDGNLERAEEAKRKLVDEIVPAIRQGMDGADKKFSLVMEMVRLRADAKGFDRDSIRELEVLLR